MPKLATRLTWGWTNNTQSFVRYVLFSKSIIPYDASSQYSNYKGEAERLLKMKQEVAEVDSELKSQQDINFWKYMELVLTSS